MNDVAVAVAQDLHFDVLRAADIAFEKDRAVAERGCGLARGFFELARELVLRFDDAHAASAAAERSFDDEREADSSRASCGLSASRDGGNAGALREFARGGLVAE